MVALTSTPVRPAVEAAEPPVRRRRTRPFRPVDAVIMLGYGLAAFLLYRPLWLNLDSGYLRFSGQDQNLWEWFYAVTAHNVLNFENLLFTTLQNHPDGVNLSANTAMYGLALPLTPVTILFGPTATFTLVLTGGLAGTASAWYWVLSRHLVDSRVGAAVGAAFCGFAPPMISHANAHPNWVALFVMPFIVLWLLKIVRGAPPVSSGIVLGLLVTWQVFIGKEPLLVMATTMVVFALVYALMAPGHTLAVAPRLGAGLGVGAAVSLVIVAVPLWWQFFGPQSYSALEHGLRGNDAAAFTAFASDSLAGGEYSGAGLAMNRTEENAFFGWPLVLVVLGITVALWRVSCGRRGDHAGDGLDLDGRDRHRRRRGTSIPGRGCCCSTALFESVDPLLPGVRAADRHPAGDGHRAGAAATVVRPASRRGGRGVGCCTALCRSSPPSCVPTQGRTGVLHRGDWRVYVGTGRWCPCPTRCRGRRGPALADGVWAFLGGGLLRRAERGRRRDVRRSPQADLTILEYVAMRGETYRSPLTTASSHEATCVTGRRTWWSTARRPVPARAAGDGHGPAGGPGHPVKDVWVWDVHALLTR